MQTRCLNFLLALVIASILTVLFVLFSPAVADEYSSQRAELIDDIRRYARMDSPPGIDEAVAAVNRGAYEKAAHLYLKILEQEPDHVLTYLNLGNVYSAVQEFEKAEEAYRRTLEINPYYAFGSFALAKLYLQTNRPDRAVTVLQKVKEWPPYDPELRRFLNRALKNSKS